MREISHRFRNDLNSVLSSMQLKRLRSAPDLDSIFSEVENRAHAISSLHEPVAHADDVRPDANACLTELVEQALQAVGGWRLAVMA